MDYVSRYFTTHMGIYGEPGDRFWMLGIVLFGLVFRVSVSHRLGGAPGDTVWASIGIVERDDLTAISGVVLWFNALLGVQKS